MNTVNVIEYADNTISSLRAFEDTPEGNKAAEKLFSTLALENEFDHDNVEYGLEDGYLENGDYQIFIIHSH